VVYDSVGVGLGDVMAVSVVGGMLVAAGVENRFVEYPGTLVAGV
jgi:hypothetical protein